MNSGSDDSSDSACQPRDLGLSKPPSRSDLAMTAGKATTTWSCDDGFAVTLRLPGELSTSLESRQLSVDSYRSADPKTDAPTTIDVHSTDLDVASAIATAQGIAGDLDMDASLLRTWEASVLASTGVDDVKTPFLEKRTGYLTVQMQAIHQGVSKNNYLHLVLSWGG